MSKQPTRAEALAILKEYNETDSLLKHALSVEGVMRHFANILSEDPEKWGIIGLLHDLDYEKFPEEHCSKTSEILSELDIDPLYIRAIMSHGYGMCTDIKPELPMEKVLYTIDELTGLVTATALMRPSKSVMDLEYKSLWKKYKTASFASGVNRTIIENGCKMLDMDLKYVIEETIIAMRGIAGEIGL